jgi:hypothetical protein
MWFFAVYILLALVVSSFLFWRFYRKDFEQEDIFSHFLTVILISGVAGYFLGEWGAVFAFLATLGSWCYYKKWDFGEWLDYWILIVLPWVTIVHYFALAVWVVVLILNKNYRNFSWYESGKRGFSGLSGLIFWGMSKAIVAIVVMQKVYWLGLSVDQWFGIWLAVGGATALYLKSGRKIWHKKQ